MADGLFPGPLFDEVSGAASVLGYYACQSNLGAQPAAQKTLKQWMQTKFFAAPVAGHRHENVSAHEGHQRSGAADLRIKVRTGFHLDAIQQGNAREELPHLWRLCGQHLFSEVFEDIAL
jgi:hypothetical protein